MLMLIHFLQTNIEVIEADEKEVDDHIKIEVIENDSHENVVVENNKTYTGPSCEVCGKQNLTKAVSQKLGKTVCQACHHFYHLTKSHNRHYMCLYNNDCDVGYRPNYTRKVCGSCRYNKCVTVNSQNSIGKRKK